MREREMGTVVGRRRIAGVGKIIRDSLRFGPDTLQAKQQFSGDYSWVLSAKSFWFGPAVTS